jgi:shikimate kinase
VTGGRPAEHTADFGPVLVGLRGSGKSSLAAPLAAALGMQAVDADLELTARVGASIADLFAREGEAGFRRRERELLLDELLPRRGIVLATGGGAVLHDAVRQVLRDRVTLWLTAPLATLAARVEGASASAAMRPKLTADEHVIDELETMQRARQHLYREVASAELSTANVELTQLTAQAVALYRQQLARGER